MKGVLFSAVIKAIIAQDNSPINLGVYDLNAYEDAENYEVIDNDYNTMLDEPSPLTNQLSSLFHELIDINLAENPILLKSNATRSLVKNPFFNLHNLEQYGCWCRFDKNSHGSGRGQFVDPYDQLCEIHHHGVTCLAMDHGPSCNPWEVKYEYVIPSFKEVDCLSLNAGDQCKIDLCEVEAHLVLDTLKMITAFDAPKLDHNKYNPLAPGYTAEFTHEDDCPVKSGDGPGGHVWKCCGQYHKRWPFRTTADFSQSTKECCDFDDGSHGLRTYDPTKSDCCDGRVYAIGTATC